LGHVCDAYPSFDGLTEVESFARVILVPKDSRGPRLISCEPLEFQWVQQGLGASLVSLVESHPLTRCNVHFTDQSCNQIGALYGSRRGRYATLDLKDASDRVTVGLVRLLFPKHISDVLMDCRTLATVLPDGTILKLKKFAPMGSALCFPVLALTIWAIVNACSTDADARESILVYGDDVIIRADETANVITQLESFGLKVNRDKSCYLGFFRESCGVDAYLGTNVTPVRLKNCWTSRPCADTYMSYLNFSNNLYKKGFPITSDLIARMLYSVYTDIPSVDEELSCPSILNPPMSYRRPRRRYNRALQRVEMYVTDVSSRPVVKWIDGWSMLLRYFTEGSKAPCDPWSAQCSRSSGVSDVESLYSDSQQPFSVSSYTRRDTSHLVKRWRG